ncbi:MAG: S-layer homology domain-containing protein [Patescibacteria group bacterium]
MRRPLLSAVTALCVASLIGGAFRQPSPRARAAEFPDVADNHPYADAILWLAGEGNAQGYEDGTFHPDQEVNRAEFVRLLLSTMPYPVSPFACPTSPFNDIDTNFWFYKDLCKAWNADFIGGYPDGSFHAERTVSLAEAAKMAVLARSIPFETWESEAWYKPYVTALYLLRALPPSARQPQHPLTRGEVAELFYRLRDRGEPFMAPTVSFPSSSSSASSQGASMGSTAADSSDVAPCPPSFLIWTQAVAAGTEWRLLLTSCIMQYASSTVEEEFTLTVTPPTSATLITGPGTSTQCTSAGGGVTCSNLLLNDEMDMSFSFPSTMSGSVTFTVSADTSLEDNNGKNNSITNYVYLPKTN